MSTQFKYVLIRREKAATVLKSRQKLSRMYSIAIHEDPPSPPCTDRRFRLIGNKIDIYNASIYIESLVNGETTTKANLDLPPWFNDKIIERVEKQSNAVLEITRPNKCEIRGQRNQVVLALDLIEEIAKDRTDPKRKNRVSRRLSTSIRESIVKSNRKVSNCLNASEKVKRAILSCLDIDNSESDKSQEADIILISDSDDDDDDEDAFGPNQSDSSDPETEENDVSVMIIDTPDRPKPDSKRVEKGLNDVLIQNLSNKFNNMKTPSKSNKSDESSKQYTTHNVDKDNGDKSSRKIVKGDRNTNAVDTHQTHITPVIEMFSQNKSNDAKIDDRRSKVTCMVKPVGQVTPIVTTNAVATRHIHDGKGSTAHIESKPDKDNQKPDNSRPGNVHNGEDTRKRTKQRLPSEEGEIIIPEECSKDTLDAKESVHKKRKRELEREKDKPTKFRDSSLCREGRGRVDENSNLDERKRRKFNSSSDEHVADSVAGDEIERRMGDRARQMRNTRHNGRVEELRYIVIDGSNVAMAGIRLCVDYFKKRGHSLITAFLPMWRRCRPREPGSMTERHLLDDLEEEGHLVFTPSRRIGNRLVASYDDRFILELAERENGVVVSNDQYRDLMNSKASWRKIIEDRLLMYTFVRNNFMVPDDPLGRHGPSLETFLRNTPFHRDVYDSFKNNFKHLNSLYPQGIFDHRKVYTDLATGRDLIDWRR